MPAFGEVAPALAAGVCSAGRHRRPLPRARDRHDERDLPDLRQRRRGPTGDRRGRRRRAPGRPPGRRDGGRVCRRHPRHPEPGPRARRPQARARRSLLAAVAALGFGGFFVGMDAAVDSTPIPSGPCWSRAPTAGRGAGRCAASALRPRLACRFRPVLPALVLIGPARRRRQRLLRARHRHRAAERRLRARLPLPGDHRASSRGSLLDERLVAVQTAGVASRSPASR